MNCNRQSLLRALASSHVHVPVQTRTLRGASAQTYAREPMILEGMWSERAVAGQPSGSEPALALEVPLVKAAVLKGLVPVLAQGSVKQL